MKSQNNSAYIHAADFVIQLRFHDPVSRRIEIPFPTHVRTHRLSGTIDIFSGQSTPKAGNRGKHDNLLSGEGEYEGSFDPSSGKGTINLPAHDKQIVLLNFLTQVFCRLVMEHGGLILHAACVIRKDRAYIFYGRSGAGKSTICRFSPGCAIATDDITALRNRGGKFLAWGIPQADRFPPPQKYGPFKINGLYRLIQSRRNKINRLSGAEAAAGLLGTWKKRMQPQTIAKMLELLSELTDHVPAYELYFRKDSSFWKCIDKIDSKTNEPGKNC